jgi:glycosyltransferase involved in cell wall biosynthesis
MPSFMGYLKIPFFIGPIGGGETAPNSIRNGYPLHGKILDFMRDCLNIWSKFDPLMYITFKRAAIIFLKTPDSKKNIPLKFHDKIKVQVEIGTALNIHAVQNLSDSKRNPLRILFVGRFIYWKGMHLGLAAFSQLLKKIPEATLTIVGKGPDEKIWKDQTRSKKIEYAIQWIPWVTQEQLKSIYQSHDIFLFPSLHDSSGNVLLEAMTNGLPVICLDLGGPGVIVNESCGIKVSVRSKSQNTVINQLAKAMEKIISDRALYEQLRDGALMHAMNHTWSNAVQNTYSTISGNL